MFRHEWYKIWHNRKLIGFLFALLALNGLYFWYHAERKSVPAHAYKELSTDLKGLSDTEASDRLAVMKTEASAFYFTEGEMAASPKDPKYCDNLFTERELYTLKIAEYDDVLGYPAFVKKAAGAAAEYKVILKMLGGSEKNLKDVEKTSREYEALLGLTIRQTHTKGIAEALSLPSVIFFEILMAILLVSMVVTKEKEQGLLRLYSSMKSGRGRMFLTRMGAVSLGCACCNLLFLLSTIFTGCVLYGMPVGSFLSEPLQSLCGYKQAILRVNIGTFLALVYVWSCVVTTAVTLITAMVSSLVSSAMKVYVILFTFVGMEGILYLKIDDLSYLSPFKRINLVSFADPGYTIARYHNEYIFGQPVSYPLVALLILAALIAVFGMVGVLLSEKRYGVIPKRGKALRLLRVGGTAEERSFGTHTSLALHESVKYFRFEKIGYIILAVIVILLFTTKPYRKYYSSIEEMYYQSYLYRLERVEPEQYGETLAKFREEFELEQMTASDSISLSYKQEALAKIGTYVEYLQTKEGARAVDSRGYERLYNDRKQNVILGVCAVLAAILAGTAMMATEYRTGMAGQIRISPARNRVYLIKTVLLLVTVTAFFGMIYGRYIYQVLKGYGTGGIDFRAYSLIDWAKHPTGLSIAGGIALIYLKRFLGMLLVAVLAVLLTTRLKSFLLTAIVGIVALAVPLLLCLKEAGALSYVMANWFFVV